MRAAFALGAVALVVTSWTSCAHTPDRPYEPRYSASWWQQSRGRRLVEALKRDGCDGFADAVIRDIDFIRGTIDRGEERKLESMEYGVKVTNVAWALLRVKPLVRALERDVPGRVRDRTASGCIAECPIGRCQVACPARPRPASDQSELVIGPVPESRPSCLCGPQSAPLFPVCECVVLL
jgi:hypothetical protein